MAKNPAIDPRKLKSVKKEVKVIEDFKDENTEETDQGQVTFFAVHLAGLFEEEKH